MGHLWCSYQVVLLVLLLEGSRERKFWQSLEEICPIAASEVRWSQRALRASCWQWVHHAWHTRSVCLVTIKPIGCGIALQCVIAVIK